MKTKSKKELRAEELIDDGQQELWEKRKLGKNPKYAKALSKKETDAYHAAKAADLEVNHIRLTEEIVKKLSVLARKLGMSLQSYSRLVLTQHIKVKEKKSSH